MYEAQEKQESEVARLFFAVPFSDEERDCLATALKGSGIKLPANAVPMQNWHITLFFLGNISRTKSRELIEKVSKHRWPVSFDLTLRHIGAFPSVEKARVLWCGVDEGEESLCNLAQELSKELETLGFQSEHRAFNRAFKGHVTLCRFKRPVNAQEFMARPFSPVRLHVNRFVLFESKAMPIHCHQEYEEKYEAYLQME